MTQFRTLVKFRTVGGAKPKLLTLRQSSAPRWIVVGFFIYEIL